MTEVKLRLSGLLVVGLVLSMPTVGGATLTLGETSDNTRRLIVLGVVNGAAVAGDAFSSFVV